MDILTASYIIEQIRQEKLYNLTWTPLEKTFKNRSKYRSPLLKDREVPFAAALFIKFRNSVMGTYMKAFNYQQKQDKYLNNNKLDITNWDIKSFTPVQRQLYQEKNNVVDDLYSLLIKAIREEDCIDWEFLFKNLVTLRIDDYHITVIDESVKKFRNLQILVLCGNWIKDICGYSFPRTLRMIELSVNEISSIKKLCDNPPKGLMHIGLSRNYLTNFSSFEALKTSAKFKQLRSLDLSDNDIYDLMGAVESLTTLKSLTSLQLEGNPCAVCTAYKDIILSELPNLLYLDNVQILEKDRMVNKFTLEETYQAALTFTCHRIMGLPAPPKEKGVIQTIHLEITLPLLEEIILEVPEEYEEELEEPAGKKGVKDKKSKDKSKGSKKSSKSSKSKKGGAPSPYEAEDEYEKERKAKIKNNSFATPRVPWSKIIQFPEEVLIIGSPEGNLRAIRDTFRSSVNVKVVYLKVQPPEKSKKGKADKKGKGGDNKGKKGKGGVEKGKNSDVASEPAKEPKPPQETILKKITLANFFCDLRNVNWSDKTLDFYWAAHPKSNPKAIPVEGSLRDINYVEGKGKKGDEKKSKTESEKGTQELTRIPSKEFLPNMFTCQVGFGLKRSFLV